MNAWPSDEELSKRILAEMTTPQHFSTREGGLRVMEMQRERMRELRAAGKGIKDVALVGGFAQLSVITRELIQMQIVHRWPDRVGENLGEAA